MSENIRQETYSTNELCVILDLSYKTVLKLIENGSIPAIRLGRQWRVPREVKEQVLAVGETGKVSPTTVRQSALI